MGSPCPLRWASPPGGGELGTIGEWLMLLTVTVAVGVWESLSGQLCQLEQKRAPRTGLSLCLIPSSDGGLTASFFVHWTHMWLASTLCAGCSLFWNILPFPEMAPSWPASAARACRQAAVGLQLNMGRTRVAGEGISIHSCFFNSCLCS